MGQRLSRDREFWEEESAFILAVSPQRPGEVFSYRPETFQEYAEMQAGFAEEDGFADLAQQMRAHVNA